MDWQMQDRKCKMLALLVCIIFTMLAFNPFDGSFPHVQQERRPNSGNLPQYSRLLDQGIRLLDLKNRQLSVLLLTWKDIEEIALI